MLVLSDTGQVRLATVVRVSAGSRLRASERVLDLHDVRVRCTMHTNSNGGGAIDANGRNH